jgi:hypothetical protein
MSSSFAGQRIGVRALALLGTLLLLVASSLWPASTVTEQHVPASSPCAHRVPRVVSHRAVDEDRAGPAPSTAARMAALLEAGVTSFDLDVFWADDGGGRDLYIGHPPSLRRLWRLDADPPSVRPAALLAAAQPDGLLRLADALRLLAGHRRGLGQISLELKFPTHPEWRRRLRTLYEHVRDARLEAHTAAVAMDAAQAAAHREAASTAGLVVPVLGVLRDVDAPLGADGARHANLTVLAHAPFDGWSASVHLLDAPLRTAATARLGLAVWTVDGEPELRRAWTYGANDVVTNRPLWARQLLERWREESEASCRAGGNAARAP